MLRAVDCGLQIVELVVNRPLLWCGPLAPAGAPSSAALRPTATKIGAAGFAIEMLERLVCASATSHGLDGNACA